MCGSKNGAQSIPDSVVTCSTDTSEETKDTFTCTVLVTFSPFKQKNIKECGEETLTVADDGLSYTIDRMVNAVEWEYPKPADFTPDYDKIIYVNCGNLVGLELYNVCNEETGRANASLPVDNNPNVIDQSVMGVVEEKEDIDTTKLIEEVVFAVRQLKDYLFALNKEHPDGGTVKLYICAIYPVECLLFAFERAMGCVVDEENEKLYSRFTDEAIKDPILAGTTVWLDKYHWKIKLEYCGVHQLYLEKVTKITPRGIDKRHTEELEKDWAQLYEPTDRIRRAYSTMHGIQVGWFGIGETAKENAEKEYNDAIKAWEDKGFKCVEGKTREKHRSRTEPDDYSPWTHLDDMSYPVLPYLGTYVTFLEIDEKLDGIYRNWRPYETEDINWQKQLDDANKQIEKKYQEYYELNELSVTEREKFINSKMDELAYQKTNGTKENSFWEERYAQDYDVSDNHEKDIQYIEFEGELLDQQGLEAKLAEARQDKEDKKQQILNQITELQNYAKKVEDIIHDTKWNQIIGGIQLGLAIACIVLTPFAAPFAGVALALAIGYTVLDIGLEIVKWQVVEDDFKDHLWAIGLDVVFFAIGRVISKIAKTTAVKAINRQAVVIDNNVREVSSIAEQADTALSKYELAIKDAAKVQEETKAFNQEIMNQVDSLLGESKALHGKVYANNGAIIVEGAAKETEMAQIFVRSTSAEEEAARLLSTASTLYSGEHTAAQNAIKAASKEKQVAALKERLIDPKKIAAENQLKIQQAKEVLDRADAKFTSSLKRLEDNMALKAMKADSERFLNNMGTPLGETIVDAKARYAFQPGGFYTLTSDPLSFASTALGYDLTENFVNSMKLLSDPKLKNKILMEHYAYLILNTGKNLWTIKNGIAYFDIYRQNTETVMEDEKFADITEELRLKEQMWRVEIEENRKIK